MCHPPNGVDWNKINKGISLKRRKLKKHFKQTPKNTGRAVKQLKTKTSYCQCCIKSKTMFVKQVVDTKPVQNCCERNIKQILHIQCLRAV